MAVAEPPDDRKGRKTASGRSQPGYFAPAVPWMCALVAVFSPFVARDVKFALAATALGALPVGLALALLHRPVKSVATDHEGIRLEGWRPSRFIRWKDVAAVSLREYDTRWGRDHRWATVMFHTQVAGKAMAFTINWLRPSEGEELVRNAARLVAHERRHPTIDPLTCVTDPSVIRVAVVQLTACFVMGTPALLWASSSLAALALCAWFAFVSTTVATLLRASLRRRVLVWKSGAWTLVAGGSGSTTTHSPSGSVRLFAETCAAESEAYWGSPSQRDAEGELASS